MIYKLFNNPYTTNYAERNRYERGKTNEKNIFIDDCALRCSSCSVRKQ